MREHSFCSNNAGHDESEPNGMAGPIRLSQIFAPVVVHVSQE